MDGIWNLGWERGLTSSKVPSSSSILFRNLRPAISVLEIIFCSMFSSSPLSPSSSTSLNPLPSTLFLSQPSTFPLNLSSSLPPKMAPPISLFPSHTLPYESQISLAGKKRKDFDGDLSKCAKYEMVQYNCSVDESMAKVKEGGVQPNVRCFPVERFFRR